MSPPHTDTHGHTSTGPLHPLTTAPHHSFMGSFSASFSPSCAQGRGGAGRDESGRHSVAVIFAVTRAMLASTHSPAAHGHHGHPPHTDHTSAPAPSFLPSCLSVCLSVLSSITRSRLSRHLILGFLALRCFGWVRWLVGWSACVLIGSALAHSVWFMWTDGWMDGRDRWALGCLLPLRPCEVSVPVSLAVCGACSRHGPKTIDCRVCVCVCVRVWHVWHVMVWGAVCFSTNTSVGRPGPFLPPVSHVIPVQGGDRCSCRSLTARDGLTDRCP